MATWPTKRIGDIAEVKGGKRLPAGKLVQDEPTPYRYIRVTDFTPDGLDRAKIKHLDEESQAKITRYIITDRDVYISIAGTIGLVGIVPPDFSGANLTENAAKICEIQSEVEPQFLMYYLRTEHGQAQVASQTVGTSQPKLALFRIKDIEVPCPPLPVQRRIAGILSAYDELMENSQRRIRLLEAMARALYREWFVHFRFPGHEKHPRVASPLGDIPQGWEVKKLGELASYLNRGLSPSYDDNGDSMVINQKCIRDQRLNLEPARRQTKPVPADKRVRFGDVLINSTGVGTLGRVAQVYQDLGECTVDTHVTIARPNHETDLDFFGCTLFSHQETFDRLGVGATGQTELSRTSIANVELVVPPTRIQRRFGEIVRPMRAAAMTHANQIQNLRRTRDLLLPRLLSGQVSLDVSAVEDVAEPTAPAPPRSQVALGNALPGEVALRAGRVSAGGRTDSHPQTPPPCEVKLRSESHSQVQLGNERPEEEPALRAAEEAPPYRVERAGHGLPPPAEPADEAPVPIDQIDRTAVLQVIRQVFSEGPPRERDAAIRDVARALCYRRTGARIHEILHTDLLTAVRRGILENTGGELRLLTRSITDYERDFLKQQFLAAIGRPWIDRDTATRDFCRWLGFARTGPVIEDTARSLIHGLLREGRLEADGAELIRRV